MKTTNKYHDELLALFNDYPELTFQNKGYENLSKEIVERHKEPIKRITEILTKTIGGFSSFQNFKTRIDGTIVIRLQFDYNYDNTGIPFIGVGYFILEELKDFEIK